MRRLPTVECNAVREFWGGCPPVDFHVTRVVYRLDPQINHHITLISLATGSTFERHGNDSRKKSSTRPSTNECRSSFLRHNLLCSFSVTCVSDQQKSCRFRRRHYSVRHDHTYLVDDSDASFPSLSRFINTTGSVAPPHAPR
jgi:hypothetical protein